LWIPVPSQLHRHQKSHEEKEVTSLSEMVDVDLNHDEESQLIQPEDNEDILNDITPTSDAPMVTFSCDLCSRQFICKHCIVHCALSGIFVINLKDATLNFFFCFFFSTTVLGFAQKRQTPASPVCSATPNSTIHCLHSQLHRPLPIPI